MICRVKSWTGEPNSERRRSAYVLVELVVVLVLISIAASATMLSLRAPLRKARLERLLTSLEDADHRARMEAKRSGANVELTIDSAIGVATQTVHGRQRQQSARPIPFTGGLHVDRFSTGARRVGSEVPSDEVYTIRIAPTGRSDSYAVRLLADRNDRQSQHTWFVVVGATGQYIRVQEDADVEAIINSQR